MPRFLEYFGIHQMPWVVRAYLVLLVLMLLLLIAPGLTFIELSEAAGDRVNSLGADGVKLVLGAVLGSLSMAARHEWGGVTSRERRHTDEAITRSAPWARCYGT